MRLMLRIVTQTLAVFLVLNRGIAFRGNAVGLCRKGDVQPHVAFPVRRRSSCRAEVTASIAGGRAAAFLIPAGFLLPPGSMSTIAGGALAGGLHAVAGPDHLAAVLPRCFGKRWWDSSRIGAIWAFGHGISASLLGLFAFYVKGQMSQGAGAAAIGKALASWAEVAIGLSLIAIGGLGIKEAREWKAGDSSDFEMSPSEEPQTSRPGGKRAILLNGILHGFSWDGTPSLAPALALPSLAAVLVFLTAYSVGTMVAMSTVTTIIGEGSLKVGEKLDRPDLPQKLSFVSSGLAALVGLVWTARALPSALLR